VCFYINYHIFNFHEPILILFHNPLISDVSPNFFLWDTSSPWVWCWVVSAENTYLFCVKAKVKTGWRRQTWEYRESHSPIFSVLKLKSCTSLVCFTVLGIEPRILCMVGSKFCTTEIHPQLNSCAILIISQSLKICTGHGGTRLQSKYLGSWGKEN
jgi:hypothetical protein